MATLKSTKIYSGNLTLTDTIVISNKSETWIHGFGRSPINIAKATDSSNFNPWIIHQNTSSSFYYYSHACFGTYNNDITLVGLNKEETDETEELPPEFSSKNNSKITIYSSDDPSEIDTNCMVRWWFDSNSGGFGVVGSKKRLNNKNCHYIHLNNYTSYMPSKTGSGASGTWGINISGNAAGLSSVLAVSKGGTGKSSMHSGSVLISANPASRIGTYSYFKGADLEIGYQTSSGDTNIQVANYYNCVRLTTNSNAGIYCYAPDFSDGVNSPPSGTGYYTGITKWLIYINKSGTVTKNTSDKRRKFYIEDMPEDEARVLLNIPIRNFIYKEDIGHNDLEQNGIFAQDLREAMKANNISNRPWLQWEYNDNDRDDVYYDINSPEKDDMTYSVSYNHMVPALIKGWQMQNKEIEELEKKLAILRIKKINGLSS